MKFFIFISIIVLFTVYVLAGNPPNVTYPYKQECGLYVIPKINKTAMNPRIPYLNDEMVCGLCLDVVKALEMFAECYESDVQDIATNWCVQEFDGSKNEAICRYIVDWLIGGIESWTESFDPATTCNDILFNGTSVCVDN